MVVGRLVGERREEAAHPFRKFLRRLGVERPRSGQRDGHPEQPLPDPEPDQRRADRRPGAAIVQPGVQPHGRGQQGARRGGAGEVALGHLHFALLVEVRRRDPLVQAERGAGRREDGAAIDDAQRVIHAQSQPLQHGGEVPGIDAVTVDRGLAPYRLEPGPVEESRTQRVVVEGLVEPCDGARSAFESSRQRGGRRGGSGAIGTEATVQHQRGPAAGGMARSEQSRSHLPAANAALR